MRTFIYIKRKHLRINQSKSAFVPTNIYMRSNRAPFFDNGTQNKMSRKYLYAKKEWIFDTRKRQSPIALFFQIKAAFYWIYLVVTDVKVDLISFNKNWLNKNWAYTFNHCIIFIPLNEWPKWTMLINGHKYLCRNILFYKLHINIYLQRKSSFSGDPWEFIIRHTY